MESLYGDRTNRFHFTILIKFLKKTVCSSLRGVPSPAFAKISVLAGKKRRARSRKDSQPGKKKRKREDAPKRGCIIKIIKIIINYLGVIVIRPAKGPMGP